MSHKKRVQFSEPYRSKELQDAQSDFQVFQDYNSEHLLQFKSPRPTQSFTEYNTRMEPKISSLIDDDIELDDNGESVATKREMFSKFQQFDVFLIKNREKIEGRTQLQQIPTQQLVPQQVPSLVDDLKSNRMATNGPLQVENPAFSGLKDIRIDFSRVANNIPPQQLQDIMNNNNNQMNNDINSNMNSGRFLMLNGINPSSDSINNGENFSFFQNKKTGRRINKAMTIAQTQNITEVTTNFGAIAQNIESKRAGFRSVQDVILRLSIRSSLMVYKFIRLLKRKTRHNCLQELTPSQLLLINDLSHFHSDNNKNKSRVATAISHIIRNKILFIFSYAWKYIRQQVERCLSCIQETRPIDPTSNWMLLWLVLQFVFIIVALFYTPLELINGDAYDKKYGRPWILYKVVNCIAFFLDIIIKFNLGLFEKGQIVMNRREIVKSYFRGNFFFDVLALIPITQTLLQIDYLRPINLLILLKVQTARRILTQIQEMISQKNNKVQHALSLLQLLLMICSVCHIFACLFMGIAVLEEKYELTKTNWMEKIELSGDNVHWFVKYNASLYFAVTTMITVGYGDIAPVTTYEIFFVTIAMFVSCGVFAYSFNQIGDLVREQNRMSTEFKNEMVLVNRLLEKKKINRDLKLQVRKFLEYRFYAEPQLSMEEERMVMSKLSHHLREKVILESNLQIINQCTLLTNNFSKEFLENLALKMNELRVSKNEIIFEQNDQDDDPCLYIVDKGNIEIFVETDKHEQDITILQVLNQGSYFGEVNFFKEGLRSASARASDFTILYGIPKSQFLDTIQDYPRDFEQYCFMKDSLIYDNKIRVIDMKCFACGRDDHFSKNCTLIHYVPDKERIILKNNYSKGQQREVKIRLRDDKFNAYKNHSFVQDLVTVYMENEQNQNFIQINYHFLMEENSVTEENVVDQTHNTSNIGGVNNNPNQNGFGAYANQNMNNQNNISNNNNNNNNNNNMNNNFQRDKQPTILPDIKRHVSNVYTSGGSVLNDLNHRNDISKDISDLESPRSNERGQTNAFTYMVTNQQQSTQNTNSNFYPPAYMAKTPSNRFGQLSQFQNQQNGYLGVNSYATFGGAKKKTALKKFGNFQTIEDEDNPHNQSYQAQSPNNNAMIQQLMTMLQKMMQPQNNNNGYGYSQQNINSFTNIPHFGGGGGHSILRTKGQPGSTKQTHESEDFGFFGTNNSRNRANTRYLSYLHKKREKELMLQAMQLNNQFYSDGMQNVDINQYFDKSKIYTVYYPQHNLNTVLKAIENTPLKEPKQPAYFGVYSFSIRAQSKRKHLQQKEEQYLNHNNNNNNNGGNLKNSVAVINLNGNAMHNSTVIFSNAKHHSLFTFNQSFGLRHKGSLNGFKEPTSKTARDKETDSFKQKKNSLKPFNSLNHLKNSTLRADSIVFGGMDKAPTKSNFGQFNNASECASIYQEKEKIYYPKFIFKKLFTLS